MDLPQATNNVAAKVELIDLVKVSEREYVKLRRVETAQEEIPGSFFYNKTETNQTTLSQGWPIITAISR